MAKNDLRIVHFSDVPQGGFAGIVEKQMVVSTRLTPRAAKRKEISHGFSDFIYLAMGHFKANDGASLHPHDNVDIVTLVLSGSISHAGSLADGTVIHAPGVQVQRCGTGITHSEVNPGNTEAEFVQIWFMPPERGLDPDYQNFELPEGVLTTVLGDDSPNCFSNRMTCKAGTLPAKSSIVCQSQFVALITQGSATANGIIVKKGDLLEGSSLELETISELGLVLIH